MGLRVREGGKSESLSVMGRIEVEPIGSDRDRGLWNNMTSRANGQTSAWSLITRERGWVHPTETVGAGKADDGGGNTGWCALLRSGDRLEPDQLEEGQPQRKTAPSAYREGGKGKEKGQGASLAMALDPFVQRQSLGRETSDREPRQKDTGGGRGNMGHAQEEGARHRPFAPARLSGTTTEEDLHTEEGW